MSTATNLSRAAGDAAVSDTEVRIRTAAIVLFAERGYAATGIRDIAGAAGITTAAIYHHFANKEELLVDIIRVGQQALNERTARSLEGVERPEQRLALLISGLVATHGINRMSALVGDTELRALTPDAPAYRELVQLRDDYEALWSRTLRDGASEGVFEFAAERSTRLGLLTMCTGISRWYRPGGELDLASLCAHFTDLGLAAVRARRGRRPVRAAAVTLVDPATVPRIPGEPEEEAA